MNLHKACIVFVAIVVAQALADDQCPEDDDFARAVAHGIHSIKINNIQFYFNEHYDKVDNGIPTINPNLSDTEHDVLENALFFKSDFKQMGLQEMDYIMSQNSPDFLFRLGNPLEKIGHSLHMNEMWAEAALAYMDFVKNPPSCQCLQENLIKIHLKKMASTMRAENEDVTIEENEANIILNEKDAEKQKRDASGYKIFIAQKQKRDASGYQIFNAEKQKRDASGYKRFIAQKQKRDASGYKRFIAEKQKRDANGYKRFIAEIQKRDASGYKRFIAQKQKRDASGYKRFIAQKQKRDASGYKRFIADKQKRDLKSMDNHHDITLGTLKGPQQWILFRNMLLESMPDKKDTKYLAHYLYCKLNNKSG
jgi:hypothetical protein